MTRTGGSKDGEKALEMNFKLLGPGFQKFYVRPFF